MSHIVTIQTQVRDPAAIRLACARLQLPERCMAPFVCFRTKPPAGKCGSPSGGTRSSARPTLAACGTTTSKAGGEIPALGAFLQRYAVEKTRLESRLRGHTVLERPLADGSIHLTVQLGAA